MSLPTPKPKLQVAVEKPTPYTFDLGLLLANDANPLSIDKSNIEGSLAATARDGTQALINQLLTTRPITAYKTDGVLISLPPASTPLPREKPVPALKPPTRWQVFASKRGVKPKTREQRRNARFDAETGEWQRRWGYGGANMRSQREPVVELSAGDADRDRGRKEGATGNVRGNRRKEIRERVKRNERLMRRNASNERAKG